MEKTNKKKGYQQQQQKRRMDKSKVQPLPRLLLGEAGRRRSSPRGRSEPGISFIIREPDAFWKECPGKGERAATGWRQSEGSVVARTLWCPSWGHRCCYPRCVLVRGMRAESGLGRWGGPPLAWETQVTRVDVRSQGISAPTASPPTISSPCGKAKKDPNARGDTGKNPHRKSAIVTSGVGGCA